MTTKRIFSFVGLLGALPAGLWLAGCGGGGSETTSVGNSRATVMLTDSLRDDYSSIWATVLKAELTNADGSVVVLFDDPDGQVLDLRRLRDLSGARYSFLASTEIPAGTYTGITVTVAPNMTLFPRGSITGQMTPITEIIARDSNGNVPLALTFASPKTLSTGGDTNLVVDFDLANFKVENGKVIPVLREGPLDGLINPERHERHEIRGVIARLEGTAPTQTFSLRRRDNRNVPIVTTADTAIFYRGSTTTAALAVNQVVEVEGRYNTTTDRFVATKVVIKNDTTPDDSFRVEVKGGVDEVNAERKSLVIVAQEVEGTDPTRSRFPTTTDENTIYRSDRGVSITAERFFAYLLANPTTLVEAKGSLNSATGRLTARILKIEDDSNDGGWEDGSHNGGDDRGGNDDNGNDDHGNHGGNGGHG